MYRLRDCDRLEMVCRYEEGDNHFSQMSVPNSDVLEYDCWVQILWLNKKFVCLTIITTLLNYPAISITYFCKSHLLDVDKSLRNLYFFAVFRTSRISSCRQWCQDLGRGWFHRLWRRPWTTPCSTTPRPVRRRHSSHWDLPVFPYRTTSGPPTPGRLSTPSLPPGRKKSRKPWVNIFSCHF